MTQQNSQGDWFKILGIEPDASRGAIENAYRKKSIEYLKDGRDTTLLDRAFAALINNEAVSPGFEPRRDQNTSQDYQQSSEGKFAITHAGLNFLVSTIMLYVKTTQALEEGRQIFNTPFPLNIGPIAPNIVGHWDNNKRRYFFDYSQTVTLPEEAWYKPDYFYTLHEIGRQIGGVETFDPIVVERDIQKITEMTLREPASSMRTALGDSPIRTDNHMELIFGELARRAQQEGQRQRQERRY